MKRIAFAVALLAVSIGNAAALDDPLFPGKDPLFENTKCVTDDNGGTLCDGHSRKPFVLTEAAAARMIWRSPSALIEGYRLIDANLQDPHVWQPLVACTITPMKTQVVRVGWATYQNYSRDYFSSLDPLGRYDMATVEVVDRADPAFGCRGFVLHDRLAKPQDR